ncbi:MAG TPA: dienelactone hydrolase family protein [Caulobacteraceae bacterium]|jgi:dienelactone hydrolase
MGDETSLSAFERFDFTDPQGRWTRPVYRRGSGPAVIVIHEMPGLHPLVLRFASRVADAGMTVFCPHLFGEAGKPVRPLNAMLTMASGICIRREFSVWAADRSSPIVDWLRALARQAHGECGGRGVGAVGMCFTGNFALAMMTEPAVVAPVLSQPSLPLPMGPGKAKRAGAIGVSPAEIACARRRMEDEDLTMLGLRFRGDPFVSPERFEALQAALGPRFEAVEFDPKDAAATPLMPTPHSVLTMHLKDDDPDGPTKQLEQRVIAFFQARTAAAEPQSASAGATP